MRRFRCLFAFAVIPLLAGCRQSSAEEERTPVEPPARPAAGAHSPDEAAAYRSLLARFGRPAPDRGRREAWALAQVEALESHLSGFPQTPNRLQILQWLVTNELNLLRRFDRARDVLRRMGRFAATAHESEREPLLERVDGLSVLVARAAGDGEAEIAHLDRLLARPGLANRVFFEARRDELLTLAPGRTMPDWTAMCYRGGGFGPRDWAGRVLLLWFWAPDHPTAVADLRAVSELHRAASDRVVIVGVPLIRSERRLAAVLLEHEISWPQLWEPDRPGNDHPLVLRFNAMAGPRGFVIDRRGVIRYRSIEGSSLARVARSLADRTEPRETR